MIRLTRISGRALVVLILFSAEGVAQVALEFASRSFLSDRRAVQPGDIVTVIVTEAASASTTARTRTDKEEDVGFEIRRRAGTGSSWRGGWDTDYEGGGEIARSGRLLARITTEVVDVTPAGHLVVSGEQLIELNNEAQRIRVSGIVRADDIESDNTVPSWRLHDAQIEFVGQGVLGKAQRPGPISRLLSFFRVN